MSVILLRLEGAMQSWGIGSRFSERNTEAEPTKSGVIGLISSALGRFRDEQIDDLVKLKMATRIDREGQILYDFHTILDVLKANSTGIVTKSKLGNIISRRFYVADASFLVGIESEAKSLLKQIVESLQNPKWPLFLGRKSFPPSSPILVGGKVFQKPLVEVIKTYPWQGRKWDPRPDYIRLVLECDPNEGEPKLDVPLSFKPRKYSFRYVKTEFVPFKLLREV